MQTSSAILLCNKLANLRMKFLLYKKERIYISKLDKYKEIIDRKKETIEKVNYLISRQPVFKS